MRIELALRINFTFYKNNGKMDNIDVKGHKRGKLFAHRSVYGHLLPIVDGVGRVVYNYAVNIAALGHECYVIAPIGETGYRGDSRSS